MEQKGTFYSNASLTKNYSVDLNTINMVADLAKRLTLEMGRTVSQGEVVRMAVRGLADRLDEEDAAEAEAERNEYELEATAAEMGVDYE